ncbi:hypothetical protein AB434_0161 [Heyndrickxia coagulans]|nr:hypothetical protein AB434_0161 [Heyndrickxia coagulans]
MLQPVFQYHLQKQHPFPIFLLYHQHILFKFFKSKKSQDITN